MSQLDFIGGLESPQPSPAPIVRNTRPSAAEEKAQLVLTLGRLARNVPPSVRSGSIQKTHQWLEAQKKALALCGNARASVPALTHAIATMRTFL